MTTENKIETSFDSTKTKIWFTSDLHLGHANIIRFCDRPFSSVEEMNGEIIKRWNGVVGDEDIVFILGDFAFGGSSLWFESLKRLKGRKYLVLGNHDLKNIKQGYMNEFVHVCSEMIIRIDGQKIYLNHMPFLCFDGTYRDSNVVWQLHGHVHLSTNTQSGADYERMKLAYPVQYDVGVDLNDFTPVSFDYVKRHIEYQMSNKVNSVFWTEHPHSLCE